MLPSDKANLQAGPKAAEKLSRIRQRQRLVEACISALYQHGPSRTTIDKVVAIADMSPGIVNFYFDTKAALLVAALEYLAEEFEDRLLAPLSALRGDPVAALRRLIDLYLDPDIASPRKVSVWYAFWGEASARSEYYAICGKRDEAFADLVRDLIARLIAQSGALHLDADAVALGLIGALEMIWQEIAFHEEADLDRAGARLRCLAYLGSVFPEQFGSSGAAARPENSRFALTDSRPARRTAARVEHGSALLVTAELTLAGVAAIRTADFATGCDVIAHNQNGTPQRISVRPITGLDSGAYVDFGDSCDWLAIVVLPEAIQGTRKIFIVPHDVACAAAHVATGASHTQFRIHGETISTRLGMYENNFRLNAGGMPHKKAVLF